MKDRVPLYPGRVKLVPVSGQENLYNMVRADQPTQEGTPLNKATLLKDATAALFGLDTNAVPDDVLAYIGKYNQYWWRRRTPVQAGDWEYLQSSDRSAYPDSGEQDGYEYQYLGIPFDNAATAPKIATGSYVGTGKYGSNNPNSLTFEFEPKIVMISSIERNDDFSIFPCFSLPESYPSIIGYGWSGLFNDQLITSQDNYAKRDGNTLSWYYKGSSSAAPRQLNSSDKTYTYIAIG